MPSSQMNTSAGRRYWLSEKKNVNFIKPIRRNPIRRNANPNPNPKP